MAVKSAVLFLSNNAEQAAYPLFLQRVMGTPLLAWLTGSLVSRGINRCLLICPDQFLDKAKACFPDSIALTCASDSDHMDIRAFLSDEEDALVITAPVVDLGSKAAMFADDCGSADTGVYAVSGATLQSAPNGTLVEFLEQNIPMCTEADGFVAHRTG